MLVKNEYYDETKDPIFTIETMETGKTYKIYIDGRVKGFGEKVKIFNRIPMVCGQKVNMNEHDILLSVSKALAEVIENFGWQSETFYSDVKSRSLHSSKSQEETVYLGSSIIFSPESSDEKFRKLTKEEINGKSKM